ncbi:MAG TPA: DinB family protein [Thermomicrobiales bacterium]
MAPGTNSLTRFYDGWPAYQSMLVERIATLTPEQLALQAAPHQRPVWLIAAHIIGTRVGWFHGFMGEGDPSIAAFDPWDFDDAPPRTAAELMAGLTATWQMIEDGLNHWTPENLADSFSRRYGEREVTHPRAWVIWHVLEHDIHHGGELFLTLGSHGLPTPEM